jgi:hypothetical protein
VSQLDFGALELSPTWLAASLILYLAHMASQGFLWHELARLCGAPLPFRESGRIWAYSQPWKYLPGKVLRVGYIMWAYARNGHGAHKVTAVLGLEFVGNLAGVMLVVSACVFLAGTALPEGFAAAGAAIFVASIVGLHPRLLNFALQVLSRIVRKPLGGMDFSYAQILVSVPGYAVSYLFLAGANWCLYASLLGTNEAPGFALATSVFGAAGLAGTFAFFAPGGLGAREAVLQLGLQGALGGPVASLVTIASRAWFTACEVVFLGATWLASRRSQYDPEGP